MTDNKFRVKMFTTAGAPITGLTYASPGLVIAVTGINESGTSIYSGTNIESIAIIGTYVEPTLGKCRFKEVNATYHPGLYELQLESNLIGIYITIFGAAGLEQFDTSTALTVQIDTQLSRTHGSGSWSEGTLTAPTVEEIDAQLSSTHGAGRWAEQGSGEIAWQYIVKDCVTHMPVDGVWVNVTTDLAGANIIAQGTTNSFGQVVFWLDPGTYYMWSYRCGYYFQLPDTEVVTAP